MPTVRKASHTVMKIDPHSNIPLTQPGSVRGDNRPYWVLGQLLRASVNLNAAGQSQLLIGGRAYSVTGGADLRPGQDLLLRVESLGQPPQMRVISGEGDDSGLQSVLRWALPRQQPLQSLLSLLLGQAAQPTNATTGNTSLAELVQGLLARIVDAEQLTRWQNVRRAFSDSGLFMEAKLAVALSRGRAGNFDGDLLAQALRLLRALRASGTPISHPLSGSTDSRGGASRSRPERGRGDQRDKHVHDVDEERDDESLREVIEAIVAGVRVKQIGSLLEQQGQGYGWSFELPYRDGEQLRSIDVHLRKDADRKQPTRDVWTLTLEMDIEALGAMRAQLTLMEQHLSITLWAQEAALARLMESHLDRLETWLTEDGLYVDSLAAHHGLPPAYATKPPTGVLDVKA